MSVTEEQRVAGKALATKRRELRLALDDLKHATQALADPRDAIRDRPTRWLVGGLVAGFLLGWRS